jgi:Domain of unknown function (DUF4384)
MKRVTMSLLILGLAVFAELGFAHALVQEQTDNVRGAFMTTRPKSGEKPAGDRPEKAVRRRPKTAVASSTSSTAGPATTSTSSASGSAVTHTKTTTATPKVRPQKIGIGLTLFMRDPNGLSVRVDPSREFRKNDRVRVLLETNVDGYLYIFNTTDDGQPTMIYPDPNLDDAGNYIQAHVPVEVPSSVAAEERLRWFRFDAQAGVERLYFVFTREPLSGVPLEDDLISYCREKNTNCPMQPATELWSRVKKELGTPVQGNKAEAFGTAQTTNEHQATTRGIGLSKDDPEPSLVTMTASSDSRTLVTTLDLVHK